MIITTRPCTKGENCTTVNYNITNSNLARGICNFSKKISNGLKRPETKFVCDVIYGILAAGSSVITEVARNLNEEIPLIKTTIHNLTISEIRPFVVVEFSLSRILISWY